MGFLFLIYYCITVYSAKVTTPATETEADVLGAKEETSTSPTILQNEGKTTEPATTGSTETSTKPTEEREVPYVHPTWRPKRQNCTPPAIEQFPRPLMGPYARRHGGLVIHVTVAIFTFLGLAIVCDDYFVSSLDRICEELKLSPDVAGATFMAAGSSAPELATVIIGVFFAKDDIGISGVIGSAVFNIMFVISVCALCSGTVCQLNWWPLVRDCFFYALSILVMLIIICNDVISWPESVVMLVFYVIYCITLHFNAPLEKWALSLNLPIKLPSKEEQSALVTYKNIPDSTYTQGQDSQAVTSLSQDPQGQQQQTGQQYDQTNEYQAYIDPNASWDPNAAWDDAPANPVQTAPAADSWGNDYSAQNTGWNQSQGQQNYGYNAAQEEKAISPAADQPDNTSQKPQVAPQSAQPGYYKSKDPKAQEPTNPLEKPVDGGLPAQISWAVVYPIHYMCRLTMPDCRTEKYRNWYPFTFLVSMIWISFYSYFMVWMITIIGSTLGIPDTVMGLTFVAAGVSVPDALSSIAVIKEGYGDMAVSNAVGSNVFDILVCLGLPWFIQTAIIAPGSHVNVISKGLAYSTLSLLSTVIFLLLSTHLNGWKLDRRLGIILMLWYLLFITLASLYELNVFGQLNPPECSSSY